MDTPIKDKIFSYIDAIAAKLGVASQYVYSLLVKQEIVSGIVHLLLSIVGLIVLFIAIKILIKTGKWVQKDIKKKNDNNTSSYNKVTWGDYPQVIMPVLFGGIGIVVAFLFIVFNVLPDSIMHILNPQYYAIKEILDSIK